MFLKLYGGLPLYAKCQNVPVLHTRSGFFA